MLLLALLLTTICTLQGALIETPLGQIKGREFRAKDGTLVHAFKHVPYAQPPMGELRFSLPKRVEPWRGILDGTEYAPACMSNSTTSASNPKVVDEDCLYNNIFVSDRCLRSRTKCPVVVYIHGGMFNFDSVVTFPDRSLIDNFGAKDVLLVTVEYRLGFFAGLTFGNDYIVPGNLAAYDMIEALRWVQEYISSFGGDRQQVTLFGHSGGGSAVNALTFSKTVDPKRRLFQRAIAMSPQQVTSSQDEAIRRVKTWEFAQKAGCLPYWIHNNPSDNFVQEVVDCLRTKDGFELLGIQRQMEVEGFTLLGWIIKEPLFPSTDFRDFVTNPPKVPLLIGSLIHDMDHQLEDYSVTTADFLGLKHPNAVATAANKETGKGAFNYDPQCNDSRLKVPVHQTSESQSIYTGVYTFAQQMTKAGADVYLYSYRYPKHAVHTDDMFYLLGIHPFVPDENEQILGRLYPQYIINFIKTGVPHEDWEKYRLDDNNYYAISWNERTGERPGNALHYEQKVIDFWMKNLTNYDEYLTRSRSPVHLKGLLIPKPTFIHNHWVYLLLFCSLLAIGGYLALRKAVSIERQGNNDQKVPLLQ